jgi:beta-phosphoglucomutase family hydrolase
MEASIVRSCGVMPESILEAVLWDMDGVIADTAYYHYRAWHDVFQKRGVNFTEKDFKYHFGRRNDTIIRSMLGESISLEELDIIISEKEENYRRRVARNIKPLPGALELISALGKHGIKIAIASSAPMENIRLIIRELDIEDCFQAIVWGGEVAEGKPDPQIFLLAARKLGAEFRNCIVIEDAVAGVAAAKRAGMKCVAVTNSHPRNSLKEADLIVDTLEAVSISDLAKLFRPAAG